MSSSFFRHVEGYPDMHILYDQGEVKLNNNLEFNQSHNPGEILGFSFLHVSGTQLAWLNMMMFIEVDSVAVFDDYLYWYAMGFNFTGFSNLFADSTMYNTTYNLINFRVHIPFETTFRLALHNDDPVGNIIDVAIYARYGK